MRVARALAITASVAGAALLIYARRRRRAALRCQPCSPPRTSSGRTGSRQAHIAFDGVDTPEPRQLSSVFDGVDTPQSSPVRAAPYRCCAST